MIELVIGLVFFGVFVAMVKREPRRFANGVVLLIALTFGLMGLMDVESDGMLRHLATLLLILSPLLVLVLSGLLIANGVQMLRREGRSPANLLSLGLGIALLLPYPLFVVALMKSSVGVAALLASVTLVASYVGFLLVAFLMYSFIYLRMPYQPGMGAIVVHGSGLIGSRVPPLLAGRLDRALGVYETELAAARRPLLITSGGQGSDEEKSEADAMAGYLIDQGLPESAILREDRSATTRENLLFTKEMLAERGMTDRMVLVTSNFHTLRTAILSRQMDLDAEVVGSQTALYYLPTAILREFAGILFEHIWAYVVACLVLAAIPLLLVLTLSP